MTIIALTCLLVVAAAAASILFRDSVPMPGAAMETASASIESLVSNKQAKGDKMLVAAAVATAPIEPVQTGATEPLRQAFAATAPAEIEGLKIASPPRTIAQIASATFSSPIRRASERTSRFWSSRS